MYKATYGNLSVCYWNWPCIVSFPIKSADFPELCRRLSAGYCVQACVKSLWYNLPESRLVGSDTHFGKGSLLVLGGVRYRRWLKIPKYHIVCMYVHIYIYIYTYSFIHPIEYSHRMVGSCWFLPIPHGFGPYFFAQSTYIVIPAHRSKKWDRTGRRRWPSWKLGDR